MAHELHALLPTMLKTTGNKEAPRGFLERLQANASKLVHIAPVQAPTGDTPADVLARIEVDAAKADIDAALTELAKLPPAAQAPAQDWIAKAKARQAALVAAQQLATDTARALAKS